MADKACFVIAPIGLPESETRKRSDAISKHVIRPAVGSCGYKATRADEMSEPGLITSQVIQRIIDDPLVVADLTENNPNVFYELALRHAISKPLIQLIGKGERIPFDVAGMRTITVDSRDLDSVEAAKEEIIAQVKSMERPGAVIDTPISVSVDLQRLRQSEKPEDRSLAELLSALSDLRSSILNIERRMAATPQGRPPVWSYDDFVSRFGIPPGPAETYAGPYLASFLRNMTDRELNDLLRRGPSDADIRAFHEHLRRSNLLAGGEARAERSAHETDPELKTQP